MGGAVRQIRRTRHVQPGRRLPLHVGYADAGADRRRHPQPDAAPPRRAGLRRPPRPGQDRVGQHNGLPTTIIVRTTLQDLESRAGIGVTGGGTLLPISDVLNLAARGDTNHYLAVFDEATGSALDLFRARRTASVAQRLMLIARDGGCTKPSLHGPAYGTQAHHAARDWTEGGLTNVDDLGLACGPDNRMVGPDGWTTRINDHHEVEWIPPPQLDTGQARINHYHRPEELHPPPDDAWTPERVADDGPVVDEPCHPPTRRPTATTRLANPVIQTRRTARRPSAAPRSSELTYSQWLRRNVG